MQALQRLSDMACAAATCRSCIELRTDEGSVPIYADLHYSVSGSCGLDCMQVAAREPSLSPFAFLTFFSSSVILSHRIRRLNDKMAGGTA
jgi:hypothetical protein